MTTDIIWPCRQSLPEAKLWLIYETAVQLNKICAPRAMWPEEAADQLHRAGLICLASKTIEVS